MKDKLQKKKLKPWQIAIITISCVIVLAFACTALTMPFIYDVQVAILRIACKPGKMPTPQGYGDMLSSTVIVHDVDYGSIYANDTLDVISPKDNTEVLPLFVYFHGGYYCAGDKASAEPYCVTIANDGYIVANVNYVLTPDEQYPAQVVQANEAIAYLINNAEQYNVDVNNVFIGGDSAGGHLSGMLGAVYTNPTLCQKVGITPSITATQLSGVVLLCGFYDWYTVRDSKFPFINSSMWMMCGVKDYESYSRADELNTISNATESYPNTYILCGDADPFWSQNQQFAARLDELGISVTRCLFNSSDNKLKHEFQREFDLAEANQAMSVLLDFMRAKTA